MRSDAGALLRVCGLRAGYGRVDVLHGVDLVVPAGSVVALLGPNGAGKTTLLRAICGQLRPSAGSVEMAGRDVVGARPEVLAKAGVCTVPESGGVFPNLTVRRNLLMATFSGTSLDDIESVAYSMFPRLGERRHQLAGTLSGGERQMLALTRALATDPAIILLDELSMGLAPLIVEDLYGVIGEVAATGVSLLVVEQFARAVLGVADYAALMLSGRIVSVGEPVDIDDELAAAYLAG